jgi:recombinational DNA repair ATPase RecF
MHITRLQAENFKKLVAIDIRPGTGAGIVPIRGKNAQGKSSTLDAIQAALGGKSVMPGRPVRAGEEEGAIRIEIDGGALVIRRTFTADGGGQIVVENADGFRTGSPQKMLDGLYGAVAFDPLAFTRLEADKQLARLRSLVKLDVDLDGLERAIAADYDKRRDKNRELKAEQARLDQMPAYEDLGQKVDETALEERISQAGEHNAQIERRRARREDAAREADQAVSKAEAARGEAAELRRRAEDADAKAAHEQEIADNIRKQLAEAEALPDPIDISEAQADLRAARDKNAKIDADQRRVAQAKLVAAIESESEALSKAIEDRKGEIAASIARAEMPVPGLSFGDGDVLFNSIPFDQASSAEQLRISTAIGMAGNPKLRVMLVRDGSLLDPEGEQLIAAMAEEHGFQFWVEAVDPTGKVGFYIEDGAVVAVDGEQAEAPEPIEGRRRKKKEQNVEGGGEAQAADDQGEAGGVAPAASPATRLDPWGDGVFEGQTPKQAYAARDAATRPAFTGSMFDDEEDAQQEASPTDIEEDERFADREHDLDVDRLREDRDERQDLFDDMIADQGEV